MSWGDHDQEAMRAKIGHNRIKESEDAKAQKSKAENLPISDVRSREEIEKLKHEIELWKRLYFQRGKIMEKWIEKYNLPIAKAVLDGTHEI